MSDDCYNPDKIERFMDVTFSNKESVNLPHGFFCSDSILLNVRKDSYICVELIFKGERIQYHPESQIISYVYDDGKCTRSAQMPVVHCVGCDRQVEKRILVFQEFSFSIDKSCVCFVL